MHKTASLLSTHYEHVLPVNSNLDPQPAPFVNKGQEANNNSVVQETRNVPRLCPVQKVKIKDNEGNWKLEPTPAKLNLHANTSHRAPHGS